jgi:hypothetical protein
LVGGQPGETFAQPRVDAAPIGRGEDSGVRVRGGDSLSVRSLRPPDGKSCSAPLPAKPASV